MASTVRQECSPLRPHPRPAAKVVFRGAVAPDAVGVEGAEKSPHSPQLGCLTAGAALPSATCSPPPPSALSGGARGRGPAPPGCAPPRGCCCACCCSCCAWRRLSSKMHTCRSCSFWWTRHIPRSTPHSSPCCPPLPSPPSSPSAAAAASTLPGRNGTLPMPLPAPAAAAVEKASGGMAAAKGLLAPLHAGATLPLLFWFGCFEGEPAQRWGDMRGRGVRVSQCTKRSSRTSRPHSRAVARGLAITRQCRENLQWEAGLGGGRRGGWGPRG